MQQLGFKGDQSNLAWMADIMAAPVTPGGMSESIEELFDKSMESESANETRSKADEDLFQWPRRKKM